MIVDRLHRRHGDGQKHERRNYRPGDFKAGVAVDLPRNLVVAPPSVPEYGIDERPLHKDENGDCHPEDEDEQVCLCPGDGTRSVERRLIVMRRTGSQNCYESNQE